MLSFLNALTRGNGWLAVACVAAVLAVATLGSHAIAAPSGGPQSGAAYSKSATNDNNSNNSQIQNIGDMQFRQQGRRASLQSNTVVVERQRSSLVVEKEAPTSSAPGELLMFGLRIANRSETAAETIAIEVDGLRQRAVVLRDTIPANTQFNSAATSGTLLYHLLGDEQHSYSSTRPADDKAVDAIAASWPTFEANATGQLQLQVLVKENASGQLLNTGIAFTESNGNVVESESNQTVTSLPNRAGQVRFFADPAMREPTNRSGSGSRVYIAVEAAGCNTRSDEIESYPLTVTTEKSADRETFTAVETAANSGEFEVRQPVPLNSTDNTPVVRGNSKIEADQNDQLTASLENCDAAVADDTLLIDPLGVVFDSRTNQPIAGAIVTLIDITGDGNGGNAGGPARVFADDGTTPAPNTVTTGEDGVYQFPRVAPSDYRLQVTPPANYQFPSQVAPDQLDSARSIDLSGSYGGRFRVDQTTGDRVIDVPLDLATGGLFIQLQLSDTTVAPGDIVNGTAIVTNNSNLDLSNVMLTLQPPAGFRFVPGSIRFDGTPIGSSTELNIGEIAVNGDVEISFLLETLAFASNGNMSASAIGTGIVNSTSVAINSNTDRKALKVRSVLGESYVIGTVYLDCDADREQGPDDIGVPGVRLYLENGSYVGTDAEGRFSIYGLQPRSHVLKIDPQTLPVGSELKALDFRHLGDGGSRFIDLKVGELHKANFALRCDDAVRAAVLARRNKIQELPAARRSRLVQSLNNELNLTEKSFDRQRLAADGGDRFDTGSASTSNNSRDSRLPNTSTRFADVPAANRFDAQDLEIWLPLQDKTLQFIDFPNIDFPNEEAILPFDQVTLRIKGRSGATLNLTANGKPVKQSRIGLHASAAGIDYWEYVAVPLETGDNPIVAELRDGFGNVRASEKITLRVPGASAQIKLIVDESKLLADGREPVALRVEVQDANGLPVALRVPVTLQTDIGVWASEDADPVEPGLQLVAENGVATALLLPPSSPSRGRLQASVGPMSSETTLAFAARLRPLLAVGLIEGIISVGKSSNRDDDRNSRLFEQQLNELSTSRDNDRVRFGGRGALFLKGRVRGDYLLTLRYDSEGNNDELFRDIQPDRFYPIYGDSTRRGFDARSTSPLYFKLERGNSYLLYGDLTTDAESDAVQLANVRRSLTGTELHYENKALTVTGFASHDSSSQRVDELPALGVSGPYQLSRGAIRAGSETVELITRDREAPSVIISAVEQTRFTDFILDPISGELVFRRPVSSVDSQLNPISIRVRYEVDGGGEQYWVGGLQADLKLGGGLTVGAGWIRDNNPDADASTGNGPRDLQNIHANWQLGNTRLQAEIARSDSDDASANGWRAELQHRGERLDLQAEVGRVDADFNNPSSSIRAGRQEARLRGRLQLSSPEERAKTSVIMDAIHSEDINDSGEQRSGVGLGLRRETGSSSFELGARHTRSETSNGEENNVTSIRGRAESRLPFGPEHRFFVEAEQDVRNSDRRLLAIGGNVQVHEKTRFFARHEISSTDTGVFGLDDRSSRHSTVVGLETESFASGQAFSEYRARNSIDGRSAEAAIGLRNQWQLSEGTSLNVAAERISALQGDANARTAISFGLQFTGSERSSGSARLEWRETEAGYSWFNTLGFASKINQSLSLLARNTLSIRRGSSDLVEDRLQLGLAWRDANKDRLHGLARYEWRFRDADSDDESSSQQAHLLTGHINWQARADLTLSGSYGIRRVQFDGNDTEVQSDAQAVFGRLNWRAAERWDIGLQTALLGSNGFSRREMGSGIEVGYLLRGNLWLAAGYNFTGFDDEDFGAEDTRQGGFLRMRVKFDETLFGGQP